MQIGIAGSGPAVEAVRAALSDVEATATAASPDGLVSFPVSVVVAPAGAPTFEAADAAANRWLAVEIGGLGGVVIPDLDAAVTVLADGMTYRDLRERVVAAGVEGSGDPKGTRSAVRLAGAIAGHRLVSLLSGADLGGTVVEVPGAERRAFAVPRGDPDRTLRRTHREASLDDTLDRAERAVDDRVGLLTRVGERESFPAPYYLARTSDTAVFGDARAASFAAGVADDWDRAFMKALGEGLERYCAGVYRREAFTTAAPTAADVDGRRAVSPTAFIRPEGDADDDPIPWVAGEELSTGDAVALPAEFVHYPPPAERYRPPITTGLGLGNSGVEALLAGLYEVIERDATMLAWYSTYEPLGLSVDDERFAALVARARAERLTVTPLLLTADVDVPVVAVAVHREGAWPRFAAGSGANLDAAAAARSALAEALQNWMELRAMGPEEAVTEEGAIGRHADFPAAAEGLVDVDGDVPAANVGPDPAPSGVAELDAAVGRATDAGLAPYAARVTTADVAELGFEAVRVLAPTAQPLFVDEPYFGERADAVPQELGYEPRPGRPFHPFP